MARIVLPFLDLATPASGVRNTADRMSIRYVRPDGQARPLEVGMFPGPGHTVNNTLRALRDAAAAALKDCEKHHA